MDYSILDLKELLTSNSRVYYDVEVEKIWAISHK